MSKVFGVTAYLITGVRLASYFCCCEEVVEELLFMPVSVS